MRFRSKRIDPEAGRICVEELRKGRIGPEVYTRIEKLAEKGVDTQSLISALLEVAESAAPENKGRTRSPHTENVAAASSGR